MDMWARIGLVMALSVSALSFAGAGGIALASSSASRGMPPVPGVGRGVYLGAWVNPAHLKNKGAPGSNEFKQLPKFDQQAGRGMAILHLYTGWKKPAPISALKKIAGHFGAIPLLDWACGDTDANIAAGKDDALIYAYAKALKAYGQPVFLRWFWEMNLATHPSCIGPTQPILVVPCVVITCVSPASEYVSAWQRIWAIFHGRLAVSGKKVHAGNVAFVWCPGVSNPSNTSYTSYYPGNGYVDWLAADGYSHGTKGGGGGPSFPKVFGTFYNWAQTQDPGSPVMIAETGSGNTASGRAKGNIQAAYLTSAADAVATTMPAVEAFVYFDAPGSAGNWDLQPGAGFAVFKSLGRLFTFGEPRHIPNPQPPSSCGTHCV
jgi:hypothetical protein